MFGPVEFWKQRIYLTNTCLIYKCEMIITLWPNASDMMLIYIFTFYLHNGNKSNFSKSNSNPSVSSGNINKNFNFRNLNSSSVLSKDNFISNSLMVIHTGTMIAIEICLIFSQNYINPGWATFSFHTVPNHSHIHCHSYI